MTETQKADRRDAFIMSGFATLQLTDKERHHMLAFAGLSMDEYTAAVHEPAQQIEYGQLYQVTKNSINEYVTVGQVYRCDGVASDCIGLHRVSDGAGTYVPRWKIDQGYVTLAAVGSAGNQGAK